MHTRRLQIRKLAPGRRLELRTLRLTDRCRPFRNGDPNSSGVAECRQMSAFATGVAVRQGLFRASGPGALRTFVDSLARELSDQSPPAAIEGVECHRPEHGTCELTGLEHAISQSISSRPHRPRICSSIAHMDKEAEESGRIMQPGMLRSALMGPKLNRVLVSPSKVASRCLQDQASSGHGPVGRPSAATRSALSERNSRELHSR